MSVSGSELLFSRLAALNSHFKVDIANYSSIDFSRIDAKPGLVQGFINNWI
jgi:hypothetical protein